MRRVAIRLPDELWSSIRRFSIASGVSPTRGVLDISETVRVLVSRGLQLDNGELAGYRDGFREGRLAGYGDFMRRLAEASR